MLVLSRAEQQRTNIHCQCGRCSTVTVTDITNNRVSLGFEAPQEVRIVRSEIDKPKQWPMPGESNGATE